MRNVLLSPKLIGLVTACFIGAGMPPSLYAMPTESVAVASPASVRQAQIEQIMQVLERPDAQVHLRLLGLSPEKVRTRLASLDDAQLTSVAEHAESVRGAGEVVAIIGVSLGAVLLVAFIVLIFYLIVKESQHHPL